MKTICPVLIAALLLAFNLSCSPRLESPEQQTSYALGHQVGSTFVRQEIKLDEPAFLLGMRDAIQKLPTKLDEKTLHQGIIRAQEKAQKKQEELTAKADELLQAAHAYMAKNKLKPSVVATASGLQYEILTAGHGKKPKDGQIVEVHYVGITPDGTIFDSSINRKQTAKFGVNQVVPGWSEALKLMPVGAKWKLTIPPELGYGPSGAPPKIPPNSVLIFELELISISNSPTP